MSTTRVRYTFEDSVKMVDVELILHTAIYAAEGVFGTAQIRMDFAYQAWPERREIVIHADNFPSEVIALMFTSLLLHELDPDDFTVHRLEIVDAAGEGSVAA